MEADALTLDARSAASRRPSTKSRLAVISETTRPAPRRAASRRNGASVTPDIGASTTRFGKPMVPIAKAREMKTADY